MTTLIFVRHGQSVSNLEQRFTGQHETPLTELGHKQAEATALYLDGFAIDRIYSSDLGRSMQTAGHTASRQKLSITPEKAFREIYAGLWEDRCFEDLIEEYPISYEKWKTDLGHARPDGGETVVELADRVFAGVERVLAENRGKTVAIFTHATPVRVMACRWFGIPVEDAVQVPFCANASVSIAEYDDDGSCRLVQYGYDEHQGENSTSLPKGIV
jgi:broad specificity phosphatase PhoE